jgi:hypothetical protein
MNFKSIIDIFRRAPLSHTKTLLGRWNIHNYSETTLKIKYATEDNCGITRHLHDYHNLHDDDKLYDDTKYIYMMGYESVHNK